MSKRKYSKNQIELAIEKIEAGTADQITVVGLVDAARRKMARRKNETRTIYGVVKRKTSKAVLFSQKGTHGESIIEEPAWWPLSQVTILERAMGPLDGLRIPEWLWSKKTEALAVEAALVAASKSK